MTNCPHFLALAIRGALISYRVTSGPIVSLFTISNIFFRRVYTRDFNLL
jgi:hypothetical protein